MDELIGEILAYIFSTVLGATVRAVWIVCSSGFTVSFIKTYRKLVADKDDFGNFWIGFAVFISLIATVIVIQ